MGIVDYIGLTVRLRRVKEIVPKFLWKLTANSLSDILCSSSVDRVPRTYLDKILFFWQRDQLDLEAPLQQLLEACIVAEPQRTLELMETVVQKMRTSDSPLSRPRVRKF